MSTVQLNAINATIRELLSTLDDLKRGRAEREDALRVVDELENQIDNMLTQLAPERITDERFSAAVNAIKEISEKFKNLRDSIVFGRYNQARRKILEVQESVRHTYRLMMLIRAGAPTTLIFQVTPQFLREAEVAAPETLAYMHPMAAQIYNVLVRRGEAGLDELAVELKIDDKTRDEFNQAVAHLIASGYARPFYTPDNRMVLRLGRR